MVHSSVHDPGQLTSPPQVLQELVGDKSLERFRVEYEKLYRALKKSHGARASLLQVSALTRHTSRF